MRQYTYNETSLTFTYPESWTVEQGKNILSVFDPLNGVGALQISIYHLPTDKSISIEEELREYVSERHDSFTINSTDSYVCTNYMLADDNIYWKYWLFLKEGMLVFCSYNCQKEYIGEEESNIEDIIRSIPN